MDFYFQDTEEEKAPVDNLEQHPVSNGPIESTNTSQVTGTTSLKHVKPEASENKKSPTQKQSQAPSIKKVFLCYILFSILITLPLPKVILVHSLYKHCSKDVVFVFWMPFIICILSTMKQGKREKI